MKRNETHEDAATTVPAITGVPVVGRGDGNCKRTGCGKPLPPGGRGRSREFCSDECRIRHYNAIRGQAAVATPPPTGGPEAGWRGWRNCSLSHHAWPQQCPRRSRKLSQGEWPPC